MLMMQLGDDDTVEQARETQQACISDKDMIHVLGDNITGTHRETVLVEPRPCIHSCTFVYLSPIA